MQSKIIHSEKPSYTQLSMITTWMGDNYMLSFAPYLGFQQSDSMQTLQKFLWRRLCVEVPCVYTYICKKTACAYPIHRHSPCQSSID